MCSLGLYREEEGIHGIGIDCTCMPTFLNDGVCLRVHAQHEVAAGQVAPRVRVAALPFAQCSILLDRDRTLAQLKTKTAAEWLTLQALS